MELSKSLMELFYKVASSHRKIRNLLTPVGIIFFFSFIGIFIYASLQVDKLLKVPEFIKSPLNVTLSILFFIVGLFYVIWSVSYFIKVKGTPVPFNPPSKLVTTGPYARTRNPMLTGVFTLLFGFGILLKSVSLVYIFTPLFILINVLEIKTVEEPELQKRLGRDYLEYKKKTPMFIPKIIR